MIQVANNVLASVATTDKTKAWSAGRGSSEIGVILSTIDCAPTFALENISSALSIKEGS